MMRVGKEIKAAHRRARSDGTDHQARRAPRVIYVSCDVTTLARDLRVLTGAGYKVNRVRGFDFFPNTHHVEIAVRALLT